MPDGYERLNKISLVFGILGVIAAVYFGISSSTATSRMEALEAANLELQKSRTSFETSYQDESLELRSIGSVFSPPDVLTITPIFSNEGGAPISGTEVRLSVNSAQVEDDFRSIIFADIPARICEYRGNTDLCTRQDLKLDTLLVTFEIDGVMDTDPVRMY